MVLQENFEQMEKYLEDVADQDIDDMKVVHYILQIRLL
jgi:hypothetical protein